MRELSLFTGAGGGILGSKLLGWATVGYVEINEYCQRVIRQRIKDGIIDNAPIFGDIRAFNSEGYAESYTGLVDIVTGGFPCQPFSVAGRREAENDERNMWPETIRTIRTVQPRYALLENVPGLLSTGYFERICGDIVESGYDCQWRILSAAEMGAPHKRDRLWIVAYPSKQRLQEWASKTFKQGRLSEQPERLCANVSDSHSNSLWKQQKRKCERLSTSVSQFNCKDDSDTESQRVGELSILEGRSQQACINTDGICKTKSNNYESEWWLTEPELGRVANGVAHRMDRLKAIGNGQVPAVVRAAWKLLNNGI